MVWHRVVTRANVAATQTAQRLACIHVDQTIPWLMVAGKIDLGCMHCLSIARKSPTQGLAYIPNTHARHYSQTSSKDLGNNPAGPIKSMNASVNTITPSSSLDPLFEGLTSQPFIDPILGPLVMPTAKASKSKAAIEREMDPSYASRTRLLSHLLKADRIVKAYELFREIETHGRDSLAKLSSSNFTWLISAVLTSRANILDDKPVQFRRDYAEKIFDIMRSVGVNPDAQAYGLMIRCYAYKGNLTKVDELCEQMLIRGFNVKTSSIFNDRSRSCLLSLQRSRGIHFFEEARKLDHSVRPYNELIKTYLIKDDEPEMLATLQLLRNAGFRPQSSIVAAICEYYLSKGNQAAIQKHLYEFKVEGGTIDTPLWNIQLRVANDTGDYAMALGILSEMRLSQIFFNHSTFMEELVALACSKNRRVFWRVYSQTIKSSRVTPRVLKYLAQMEGSLKVPTTLRNIQTSISLSGLKQFDTFSTLISGYVAIGDVQSVTVILDSMGAMGRAIPENHYALLLETYYSAGDFDGALRYVERHVDISLDQLGIFLEFAMIHNFTKVGSVATIIQDRFPDANVKMMTIRAREKADALTPREYTVADE
ncbi:hypothetical protein BSLG_010510 [Batrachochytrium salamandrivorans]|nr:hypothetical protein BASA83_002576 [Batrachochytrium salamandrivorans]KAJ1327168.1 hypothetical protein BSLG_010510 [Batrachochytrium salamandrivorans]